MKLLCLRLPDQLDRFRFRCAARCQAWCVSARACLYVLLCPHSCVRQSLTYAVGVCASLCLAMPMLLAVCVNDCLGLSAPLCADRICPSLSGPACVSVYICACQCVPVSVWIELAKERWNQQHIVGKLGQSGNPGPSCNQRYCLRFEMCCPHPLYNITWPKRGSGEEAWGRKTSFGAKQSQPRSLATRS